MPAARLKRNSVACFNAISANGHAVRLHIRCLRHYPLTTDIANMRLMANIANASSACNTTRHIRVTVVVHINKLPK